VEGKPAWNPPALDPGQFSRLFLRYAFRETLGLAMMGVALFWPAGRLDWWPAWAALAVMAAWILATAIVILRFNRPLLAERLGPRKGAQGWDTAVMSLVGLLQLARYIIAGLDQRFGWTGRFPLPLQIAAAGLCFLGYVPFVWAAAANPFFSQIVRIQSERGHTVVTGGLYRLVRHPSYAGAILFELAVPLLLASWPAVLISLASAGLLVLRTALEDRVLRAGLPGYADYARVVHWRLLPGVW
jgi:protein-S-isoprenylcysteine O-methyltransferase Ste14